MFRKKIKKKYGKIQKIINKAKINLGNKKNCRKDRKYGHKIFNN